MRTGIAILKRRRRRSAFIYLGINGLTSDAAIIGDHASISVGFPDGVTAWTSQTWGLNTYGATTYGTGASPTDYTAGDEGNLRWEGIGDDGKTYRSSALIRHAFGTAPAVADSQVWVVDDTAINIDASASGANLTFTYAISGVPDDVTINSSGAVVGTLNYAVSGASGSGTGTVTATDQYGATYQDTFTWSYALRTQATGGADLDLSFSAGVSITPTDLTQNWTLNGNTLGFAITGTAIPASGEVSGAGSLFGTFDAVTADATYTLRGIDEYSRTTDDTFTLEITVGAINPSIDSDSFDASGSGDPAQVTVNYTYTGADDIELVGVTSSSVTAPSKADIEAGTGTGSLEEFVDDITDGVAFSITGLTSTSESATHIHYFVREKNNGGESDVDTIAVSGLDFTANGFSSAEVGNQDADTVRVTFSAAQYGSCLAAEFALTGNTISSRSFTPGNAYVDLTLGTTATSGDDYTGDLSFTGTDLTDAAGNTTPTFSGEDVTNNVSAGTFAVAGVDLLGSVTSETNIVFTVDLSGYVTGDKIYVFSGLGADDVGAPSVEIDGVDMGAHIDYASGNFGARILTYEHTLTADGGVSSTIEVIYGSASANNVIAVIGAKDATRDAIANDTTNATEVLSASVTPSGANNVVIAVVLGRTAMFTGRAWTTVTEDLYENPLGDTTNAGGAIANVQDTATSSQTVTFTPNASATDNPDNDAGMVVIAFSEA